MMMIKHAVLAGLAAVVLLAGGLILGIADADADHDRARRLKEAGDILPLERILQEARKVHTGHILEAELDAERGDYIYEVEMLDDQGLVQKMKFDAKTGELLKSKTKKAK